MFGKVTVIGRKINNKKKYIFGSVMSTDYTLDYTDHKAEIIRIKMSADQPCH